MAFGGTIGTPVEVAIDRIDASNRMRGLDQSRVENLRVSMRENGWFGAILIRPSKTPDLELSYRLVVGAHRLAAWSLEGNTRILANIRAMSDLEAQQAEIDENLIRADLTPLERAEALTQRFAIWGKRFPDRVVATGGSETRKKGRPGNDVKFTSFLDGVPETMGFTAETAAELGLSKSTVDRAWRVATSLPIEVREQIHGSWIAKKEGVLWQLAGLGDLDEQRRCVDVLLSGKTKSVSEARAYAAGNTPLKPAQTPVDETMKAFKALWGKASPSARAAILDDLAGRSLPQGWRVTKAEADRG